MSAIGLTAREFITSKKFIVAVSGIVLATAGQKGFDLDPGTVQNVVYLIVAYLVGQGIADHGKEAAKVEGTVTLATTPAVTPHEPVQSVKDKLV